MPDPAVFNAHFAVPSMKLKKFRPMAEMYRMASLMFTCLKIRTLFFCIEPFDFITRNLSIRANALKNPVKSRPECKMIHGSIQGSLQCRGRYERVSSPVVGLELSNEEPERSIIASTFATDPPTRRGSGDGKYHIRLAKEEHYDRGILFFPVQMPDSIPDLILGGGVVLAS
jgi:hypothetical protein